MLGQWCKTKCEHVSTLFAMSITPNLEEIPVEEVPVEIVETGDHCKSKLASLETILVLKPSQRVIHCTGQCMELLVKAKKVKIKEN